MGGKSSRRKGFGYEREVVGQLKEIGLSDARRMFGSDGRSGGHVAEVDVEDGAGRTYQCKRTKTIAEKYRPTDGVYGQIFREDRGESFILLRFSDYLDLIKP